MLQDNAVWNDVNLTVMPRRQAIRDRGRNCNHGMSKTTTKPFANA
jgi:hypothetical protein